MWGRGALKDLKPPFQEFEVQKTEQRRVLEIHGHIFHLPLVAIFICPHSSAGADMISPAPQWLRGYVTCRVLIFALVGQANLRGEFREIMNKYQNKEDPTKAPQAFILSFYCAVSSGFCFLTEGLPNIWYYRLNLVAM